MGWSSSRCLAAGLGNLWWAVRKFVVVVAVAGECFGRNFGLIGKKGVGRRFEVGK